MKKLFSLGLVVIVYTSLSTFASDVNGGKKKIKGSAIETPKKAEPKYEEGAPTSVLRWDKMVWNFGEVEYGAELEHAFIYKNISQNTVTIAEVLSSCGCLTYNYSRGPVAPNAIGTITAKYDGTRIGSFSKSLTVEIKNEVTMLTVIGNVKPAKER